jgi:aspartate aminotransferase
MIQLAGGVPVPLSLSADDNFTLDAEIMRRQITPRTKALMIGTPANPTGRVLSRAEIDAIVQVATEHDLFVITDEVYEKLIFDGRRHYSLAAEPGMAGRTMTTNGLSKSHAMCGWRLGWAAGPADWVKLAARLHSQAVTSAASFTMDAAVAALTGPQDAVDEMCRAYQQRRDFMVPALNAISGVSCASVEGAFYLMPRFTATDKDSLQIADALIEHAGIAGTPGIAFGPGAEKHVRFTIATAMSDLERAVERLARVAPSL